MCECVFAGQTRGAWTRCEFLTENLDLDIFIEMIFTSAEHSCDKLLSDLSVLLCAGFPGSDGRER